MDIKPKRKHERPQGVDLIRIANALMENNAARLRNAHVRALTGYSRTKLHELVKGGLLTPPVRESKTFCYWRPADVRAYLERAAT